jgi:hypothetical protein
MESARILKIEMHIGLAAAIANCIRLALWHPPMPLAVTFDLLGILGAIIYLRGIYVQRKQNSN